MAGTPNTFIDTNRSFEYVRELDLPEAHNLNSVGAVGTPSLYADCNHLLRHGHDLHLPPLKFWCRDASSKEYAPGQRMPLRRYIRIRSSLFHRRVRPDLPVYLVTTAQSIFFAGGLISSYILSDLSDRLGRSCMLIVTLAMATAVIITCAFAKKSRGVHRWIPLPRVQPARLRTP